MKDTADPVRTRLVAMPGAALPIRRMVIGKPVEEVATLLPRLFNLCRAAQEVAVTRALGLPEAQVDPWAEVRRDHLMKIALQWPRLLGSACDLPPLQGSPGDQLTGLFGPTARTPDSAVGTVAFLKSGHGIAPLLRLIAAAFGPGEATANGLPLVNPRNAFAATAVENSPAARRAGHPGLAHIAVTHGRGPLWRALGRVIDLGLLLENDVPAPTQAPPGAALVPATRGLYAVRATTQDGLVTDFDRVTPTDHLLAPDGVMARTLASLPADRGARAPLLLDILDPCSPVTLREMADA